MKILRNGVESEASAEEIEDMDRIKNAIKEEIALRNVPISASKLGLIRVFKEQGIWSSVKSLIAADQDVQEEWDAAIEIRRADPITQGMIAAMQLSDEQVDALLVRAAELVA